MTNSGNFKLAPRGDREIVMTRVFDAPRNRVFEAWTRPELLQRWLLGPSGWSMPVCDIDLKMGGAFRFVWRRDADRTEMGMGGVYREVVPPQRLVNTELFDEAWYPGEALVTTVFDEQDGNTTVTTTVLYQSREARDGVLKSGMEKGVAQSYDRLAEILASGMAKADAKRRA